MICKRIILAVVVLLLVGCGPKIKDRPVLPAWVAVGGKSMLPNYPEHSMVEILVGFPYEELKVGDAVIFWDYKRGDDALTHHRIIEKQGVYFIVKGDNPKTNPVADKSFLTKENYIAKGTGRWAKVVYASP